MVDVKVSGIVRVPPEKAFAYITDFANWPRWQDDMKKAELVGGERGKVGARYHYVSKAMGQTLQHLFPPQDWVFWRSDAF